MALIHFVLPTQPAGSSDGLVLYKNGTSFAMRSRARPTIVHSNPNTASKWSIAELSLYWEFPVTDPQRIAWGEYAFNTPLTDAYDQPHYIKGYAHYMRSNRPRILYGLPRIDDGPTTFGLPTYTLPTVSLDNATAAINLTINPADDWANEDGAAMLAWAGIRRSRGSLTPTEVYQFVGRIDGSATGIPAAHALAMPSRLAQNSITAWVRTSITRADGRLSGKVL